MGQLAKYLEKMFIGAGGNPKTIQNSRTNSPTDAEIIALLSKSSRQPLRYIYEGCDLNDTDLTLGTLKVNDIGTIVWERTGVGLYIGTLAGAFIGTVIPKIFGNLTGYVTLNKEDDDTVQLVSKDLAGVALDITNNVDLVIEVLQPIT